ncbi:helix-turn-helix transcriptional regulator [Aurantiacibacter poecillastricola]|uniref:helix-turn-helix transcriptional regulator n=1 Tax=Aurantiacibacter poecillastricola TaxID=3064385 RepID=UPI00273D8A05|nr:helix-turn-helix transcriptional regulator [Aurantiacibacter sp. 219JJ12-13]MDP5260348.1 helix-turn-helix transcriptional regulator [Aurantiacibacter sp. 219JJ12-13]
MRKKPNPGVDPALKARFAVSRDGQPLSYNRLPAEDLLPWVGWLYATSVAAPDDYELNCSLLSDASFVRVQLEGQWKAQTRDGPMEYGRAALMFGPQSKAMPVSVRGSFTSVGYALRPGVGHAVLGRHAAEFVDRITPLEDLSLDGDKLLETLHAAASPEDLLLSLEGWVRETLKSLDARPPDPVTQEFDMLTLSDPTRNVTQFAKECGISTRSLERICKRDFGLPPKQVLRRARAIDMASALRGVADDEEAEDLALRYYDQSHMTREFTELFGMTPSQFMTTPQPLMTLSLESRQSRRLAMLERLPDGAEKPWAAGSSEGSDL